MLANTRKDNTKPMAANDERFCQTSALLGAALRAVECNKQQARDEAAAGKRDPAGRVWDNEPCKRGLVGTLAQPHCSSAAALDAMRMVHNVVVGLRSDMSRERLARKLGCSVDYLALVERRGTRPALFWYLVHGGRWYSERSLTSLAEQYRYTVVVL